MKKKIFLNLVMGISLIVTPAFLLASCSSQASDVVTDVKLPITIKDAIVNIKVLEVTAKPITLATVQKLFNVEASDFENVTVALKNTNVEGGQKNQIVLTAKEGFIFEDGNKSLESSEFTLSNITLSVTAKTITDRIWTEEVTASPITFTTAKEGFIFEDGNKSLESSEFTLSNITLSVTAKTITDRIWTEEVTASPITFTTIQKLFNIVESDFENVTVSLKSPIVDGTPNIIVLTANEGFIFENGNKTLESFEFTSFKELPITTKGPSQGNSIIQFAEINADPIKLTTVQKLFNITAIDFENVIVSFKNTPTPGSSNTMVLTAKEGFVFQNGNTILESISFTIPGLK